MKTIEVMLQPACFQFQFIHERIITFFYLEDKMDDN